MDEAIPDAIAKEGLCTKAAEKDQRQRDTQGRTMAPLSSTRVNARTPAQAHLGGGTRPLLPAAPVLMRARRLRRRISASRGHVGGWVKRVKM